MDVLQTSQRKFMDCVGLSEKHWTKFVEVGENTEE